MLLRRLARAARLDTAFYREVRNDPATTGEAFLTALLMALGFVLGAIRPTSFLDLFAFMIVTVLLWMLWAWLAYLLGTSFFRVPGVDTQWGHVFRTVGFAQAPGALRIALFVPFSIAPVLGALLFSAISVWQFAAMVVAVREAFGIASRVRAGFLALLVSAPFFIITAAMTAIIGG